MYSKNKTILIGIIILLCTIVAHAGPALDSANAYYTAGKLKKSIKLYKKAMNVGENPALCYFNAGNAYFQLDSLSRALMFYRQCIQIAPNFIKARLNCAIIYYMLGDLGRCIAASKQTLRMDPENKKLQLVLAAAYAKAGAIPEAAVEYENFNRKYPKMSETYLALGEIYRDLKDYKTAIDWLSEYPFDGPNYSYVLLLISDIYDKMDDLPRVLFYLQKSFDIDRKNKNTFYRIVQIQKKMGNDLVALETAMEGLSYFPKFTTLAIEAGNLAFNQRLLEKAEYCYKKAEDLGSPGAVVGLENVRIVREQMLSGSQE